MASGSGSELTSCFTQVDADRKEADKFFIIPGTKVRMTRSGFDVAFGIMFLSKNGLLRGNKQQTPLKKADTLPESAKGETMQDGRMPFESHGDEDKPNLRVNSFLPDISLPSSLPAEPVPIADMANIFGVTHRTLHFYEEKALLTSKRIGQMRVYSHRNVQRMAVINVCREVGISVASITEIMEKLVRSRSQEEADDIFRDALRQRKRELTAELSTLQRQAQQIEELLVTDSDEDGADAAERGQANDIALTDPERKCLELMAEGYAPVRLARALGLSANELNILEAKIIGKFSASNRFQAVAKAVLLGVIRA